MRSRLKPSVLKPLRWLLGLGLIAAILLTSDREALASTLGDASWALAVPAIGGLVIVHLLPAGTWKLLLGRLSGICISWPLAARTYYTSQALGSFTPASIGGDVYRYYLLKDNSNHWTSVAIPILAQRLLSYAALLILVGMAALLLPLSPGVRLALSVGVIALVGAGLLLWAALRKRNLHDNRFLPGPLRKAASSLAASDHSAFLDTLKDGLLLSFLFHLVAIALGYLLVLSLGLDGPAPATLAVLTLARLAMLLPFSPSGLGFQEGALALLFPHIGLSAEAGLAVSALNRLALLVTIGVGATSLVLSDLGRRGKESPANRVEIAVPALSNSRSK